MTQPESLIAELAYLIEGQKSQAYQSLLETLVTYKAVRDSIPDRIENTDNYVKFLCNGWKSMFSGEEVADSIRKITGRLLMMKQGQELSVSDAEVRDQPSQPEQ